MTSNFIDYKFSYLDILFPGVSGHLCPGEGDEGAGDQVDEPRHGLAEK